jgi:hypothetical protein
VNTKLTVTTALLYLFFGVIGVPAVRPALSQTTSAPAQTTPQTPAPRQQQGRSAGGDVGSGAGDIGKGAAGGAGNLAKGTGKGAADLVTLHPVNAAGDLGKGGAHAGKDVAVGTAKGTGKVAKGIGRGIKHIF